jgi:hypothetical protein
VNFGIQEIKIVHLPHKYNFGNARNQAKLFWETDLNNKQNCANFKEQQLHYISLPISLCQSRSRNKRKHARTEKEKVTVICGGRKRGATRD